MTNNDVGQKSNELSALEKFSLLIELLGYKKEKKNSPYENIKIINVNDYFKQKEEERKAAVQAKTA
ncbi:MAG: hypothetical protein MUC87_10325 [Bacteroidia bacterium]|jgi:hypothetical protein|nr:hypothetical protein [Bacteroidia bacterium]